MRLLQVWLAKCLPLDEEVALKIIEMDKMTCDLVRSDSRQLPCIPLQACMYALRSGDNAAGMHGMLAWLPRVSGV